MARFVRYEACPSCTDRGRDRRGDNLAVYSDGSSHCFSCGRHRSVTRYLPVVEGINAPKSVLPADFSREVPAAGWQWLLQYGLSWKYWQPFVGWSERDSRLVFTVGEPVEFSIGRFIQTSDTVEGRTGTSPRKWWCYGDAHKTPHVFGGSHSDGVVVLVEDLISAHKVGQVTQCIPLFGTNIFNSVIPCLRYLHQPVIMWLDQDQQHHSQKRAARLSMLTGLKVGYVSTQNDPKSHSLAAIMEIVNDV